MRKRRFDIGMIVCVFLAFLLAAGVCGAIYINSVNHLLEGKLVGKRHTPTFIRYIAERQIKMPVVYEFIVEDGQKRDVWTVTEEEYSGHKVGDMVTRK